jgi:hypothetical protein
MSTEFSPDVAEVDVRRNAEKAGTKVTFIDLLGVGPEVFAFLALLGGQIVSACHARQKCRGGS